MHKTSEEEWLIKRLDLRTQQITTIVETIGGSEDYAWTPSGTMVMGSGPVLFQWSRQAGRWTELADLSDTGLGDISRLAVSPDGEHIAIVINRSAGPP